MTKRKSTMPRKDSFKDSATNHHEKKQRHKNQSHPKNNFKKYAIIISMVAVCALAIYPELLSPLFLYNIRKSDGVASPGEHEPAPSYSEDSLTNNQQGIPDEVKNFKPHWQKKISVKKIVADGRRIPPIQLLPQKETNSSVKLYIFDNFLSDSECDGLIKAHNSHIKEMDKNPLLCFNSQDTLRQHISKFDIDLAVSTDLFSPGTTCLNASLSTRLQTLLNSNWSYSTAFYPGESKFSTTVSQRLEKAMGLDPEAGGKFQITSYPVGKAYKTHTDCVLDSHELRDRSVSVIMYLNDVRDGGETKFPDLGISVRPKKGKALVWNNMSPEGQCEPHSRHVASIVKSGSKYILMRWYYYKSFYTIGKRTNGPALPPRSTTVPMVMCDEYTHGSCRWYDEWTPQVLTRHMQHTYA